MFIDFHSQRREGLLKTRNTSVCEFWVCGMRFKTKLPLCEFWGYEYCLRNTSVCEFWGYGMRFKTKLPLCEFWGYECCLIGLLCRMGWGLGGLGLGCVGLEVGLAVWGGEVQ